MAICFFLVSCVLAIGLGVGIVKINEYNSAMRGSLQRLFFIAALTVMFNAFGVIFNDEMLATLFYHCNSYASVHRNNVGLKRGYLTGHNDNFVKYCA